MRKYFFLSVLAIVLVSCSNTEVAGGPGSVTTNGRAIMDGESVPFAQVSLRTVDYKAFARVVSSETVVEDSYTDAYGKFKLNIPQEGLFRLVVSYNGNAFTKVVDSESSESLKDVELFPTAVMQGEVDIPEGTEAVWVGVQGTDILVTTDANGVFVIPGVPANDTLQLYFVSENLDRVLDNQSVYFSPSEFVYENYRMPRKVEDDSIPDKASDSVDVPMDTIPRVVVLTEDGEPASYASVALRPENYVVEDLSLRNSLIKADFQADSEGTFSVEWPDSGSYRLTVLAGNNSFSEVFSVQELSKIDTLRVKASSSISSKVTLNAADSFAWAGVYGLDILVKTDSVGGYVLPAVPAGTNLNLYFIRAEGGEPFVEWSVKTPAEGAGYLSPEKLLYDFEEVDSLWYLSVDTLWKGSTYQFADGTTDGSHLLKDHLEWDEFRQSQVFHGKYVVAKDPYAWVLVGTGMREVRNFTMLDSIEFYAKGSGKIRVTLENWESYSKGAKAASAWVSLDSSWSRFAFKPTDLCYDGTETMACEDSWNGVKNQVKQIHIFPKGGTDFYIDNVRLYGALF